MKTILITLGATLADLLRSRASLQLEILALRQQLAMVADRDRKRLSFHKSERIFLGLALLFVARLLTDTKDLQAGHIGPMASKRISIVLDLEVSPSPRWPPGY